MASNVVIEINELFGVEPYNVYLCDTGFTTCLYINTIYNSDIEYVFPLPAIFEGQFFVTLKVVDSLNCSILSQIRIPI